jgi:hypothetical protein
MCLESEEIERVDALAVQRGITREEMLATLVQSGLSVCEQEDAPPVSQRRLTGVGVS